MASYADLLQASIDLKNAVVAGEPVHAWKATRPLQDFAIEKLEANNFKSPGPQDLKCCSEIHANLLACQAELSKAEAPDAVGKWGDGKVKAFIFELIKNLLPLIPLVI